MSNEKSLRLAFGEALVELGAKNDRVVALDADLAHATMTKLFADAYPNRFYNVGIAEQNLMGTAAGMAHAGLIPFASTFALFGAGRAFEIIRNSIAYSNANVKIACSHGGISVGEDGGSHQAIEDLALMRVIPNMTVIAPCDATEMHKATLAAAEINGPVYLRTARPALRTITDANTPFTIGKAVTLREGSDVTLIGTGLMTVYALDAAEILQKANINAKVLHLHTIKPFDIEAVRQAAVTTNAVVTCEEHSVIGGLYSCVTEALAGHVDKGFKIKPIAVMDEFGRSGKVDDLFAYYRLTADDIAAAAKQALSS